MQGYFITATDTDMGKTYFSRLLLNTLAKSGHSTVAMKPIAAGAKQTPQGLRNDDALILQQAMTLPLDYEMVNPIVWEKPVWSRNIITVKKLLEVCQPALSQPADYCIIEGAGGWMPPLNDNETYADFVKALGFPVIVVVGIRLGCLNSAILTVNQIMQMKVPIAGWIANIIDPNLSFIDENIEILKHWIQAPLLERLDYNPKPLLLDALVEWFVDNHRY